MLPPHLSARDEKTFTKICLHPSHSTQSNITIIIVILMAWLDLFLLNVRLQFSKAN